MTRPPYLPALGRGMVFVVCLAILVTLGLIGSAVIVFASTDGVTADQHARRLSNEFVATPTIPPPTLREAINAIDYQFMNPEPAKEAWYLMTGYEFGWPQTKQDLWWPFARDVMLGESGFCWNRLRGDEMMWPQEGCRQVRQGTHEDAGFGQITWVLYGPHSTLCQETGLCSRWDIIANPWNSMLTLVHVMDEQGSQPWCYDARAVRYHKCNQLAPDRR